MTEEPTTDTDEERPPDDELSPKTREMLEREVDLDAPPAGLLD